MRPIKVTAHLSTPVAPGGPLLLDGILYAGLGAIRGAEHPSGWADPAQVFAEDLPVAKVETEHGWWWAASQSIPDRKEAVRHAHRRPPLEYMQEWTDTKVVNIATGPDKLLRLPVYYRPSWFRAVFFAVGDPWEIGRLLCDIHGIGRRVTHGYGAVDRWVIEEGGPPIENYQTDLRLRHIPIEAMPNPVGNRIVSRNLPLRPPYYDILSQVRCWQVREQNE